MTGLSDSQSTVLQALFAAAPDGALGDLERALAEAAASGGAMASVHQLIGREARERRARGEVFAGLAGICRPSSGASMRFPPQTPALLWAALRETCPSDVRAALAACADRLDDEISPAIYDTLCAMASAGLRASDPAFERCIDLLEDFQRGGAEAFAKYLDLAPIARAALDQAADWVTRMTDGRRAAVRLAYKDAVSVADDGGPRLFEILYANLSEPWLIVRLLSAVMDHPAERYVCVSELARFGEYLLDDIDRRLAAFRAFNPDGGRPAGLLAAETIHIAALEIVELEAAVELNREGPWGQRIAKQKLALASMAEARLSQIEKTIDAVLPLQMVKFGKGLRGQPKLTASANPVALRRAEALLAFFDQSRSFAAKSGYGAMRTRVAEKLEGRLDQYVEDLLEMLRAQEVEALDRVRDYLDISAGLTDWACGEKAGQIVRRRMAAA
jgi:hypothetical protein